MQSYTAIRSTILVLTLVVASTHESYAESEAITATQKQQASTGHGGGHKHYAESEMANKPSPDGQVAQWLIGGKHSCWVPTSMR
jgi:hypothetical protein